MGYYWYIILGNVKFLRARVRTRDLFFVNSSFQLLPFVGVFNVWSFWVLRLSIWIFLLCNATDQSEHQYGKSTHREGNLKLLFCRCSIWQPRKRVKNYSKSISLFSTQSFLMGLAFHNNGDWDRSQNSC